MQTRFENGWNVFVQTKNQDGLELTEEEGWVSFLYTKKEPRPAFRYRIEKKHEQQKVYFATVIVPFERNIPETEIDYLSIKNEGVSLHIIVNGQKRKIEYKL